MKSLEFPLLDIQALAFNWVETFAKICAFPGVTMAIQHDGKTERFSLFPLGVLSLKGKPVRLELGDNNRAKTAEVRRTLLGLKEGQAITVIAHDKPQSIIIRDADIDKFKPKTPANIEVTPDHLAENLSGYIGEIHNGNTVIAQDYITDRQYSMTALPFDAPYPKKAVRLSALENQPGLSYIDPARLKSAMLRLQNKADAFVIYTRTERFLVELREPGDLEKVEEARRTARAQTFKRKGLNQIIYPENEHMPASLRRAPYIAPASSTAPAAVTARAHRDMSLKDIKAKAKENPWSKINYNGAKILVIAATHIPETAALAARRVKTESFALNAQTGIKLIDTTLGESFGTTRLNTLVIYKENGRPVFAIATSDLEDLVAPEADEDLDNEKIVAEPEAGGNAMQQLSRIVAEAGTEETPEMAAMGPVITKAAPVKLALEFLRAVRNAQKENMPCPVNDFIISARAEDLQALQDEYSFQTLCDGEEKQIPVVELDIVSAEGRKQLSRKLDVIFESTSTKIAIIRFNDHSPDVVAYKPACFEI